jgi:thiol-disulfide isomerase/thioredoxin
MTSGLIVLAAVLLVTTAAGFALRWKSGKFRASQPRQSAPHASAGTAARASAAAVALTSTDLGASLGERATLVQFSTEFCAPCRPTRQILAQVANMVDGVRHVEIDAAARLDLVRRLRVASTPTVLVLGPDGIVAKRAFGVPRKADVIAALGQVIAGQVSKGEVGKDQVSEVSYWTNPTGLIDNTGNSGMRIPGSDSRSDSD